MPIHFQKDRGKIFQENQNLILKNFNYKKDIPDVSSFVKSKEELASHTLQTLFEHFIPVCEDCSCETYKGFRLLAVDGSNFQIPQNKKSLHLNAIADSNSRKRLEFFNSSQRVRERHSPRA